MNEQPSLFFELFHLMFTAISCPFGLDKNSRLTFQSNLIGC